MDISFVTLSQFVYLLASVNEYNNHRRTNSYIWEIKLCDSEIQSYTVFFCFFYYQIDVKLKKPEISHSLVSNFEKKNIPFSEAFSDYTSEQVSERRNN